MSGSGGAAGLPLTSTAKAPVAHPDDNPAAPLPEPQAESQAAPQAEPAADPLLAALAAPTAPTGPAPAAPAPAAFPIVAIGASAGGLAAFEAFFAGLPADTLPGMAFVLVQHLAPDHTSILPDLVRRFTTLPVAEAADGTRVAVDSVYVMPPGWDLTIRDGTLRLTEPVAARGHRLPIDGFFRALAADRHESAIGIVLAGTGSDGAQGVRAIKDEGGLVLVQAPGSTTFDGMPRAALATGLVDHALPPRDMPACLLAYAARTLGRPASAGEPLPPVSDVAMKKVFAQLRARTRHDFTHYKATTVHRRVHRRMAVHQIETVEAYAAYLQQSPDEVQALFRDLLIGVTRFFRDLEAFQVLERQTIPALLAQRVPGRPLRVWVAGCATGEEAFSLAMLLLEQLDEPATPQVVQVFATDIDSRAIATARAGIYPPSIADDLTPERLARHFVPEPDGRGWRVRKTLRDLLIFSEHDLVRDPPFSKLDLISCRNLLIYLDGTLQKRIIPLFHYALRPGGLLFLGTSESVGEFDRLFEPVDRKVKLFRRLDDSPVRWVAAPPTTLPTTLPLAQADARPDPSAQPAMPSPKPTLRELAERAILRELPVAAALVNAQGDIAYLHGRTGMYLEPAPGEAGVSNILAMAREGLRRDLSLALAQTTLTRQTTALRSLRVKTNGHHTLVNVSVSALDEPGADATGPRLYLVLLEPATAGEPMAPATEPAAGLTAAGDAAVSGAAAGPDTEATPDPDARVATLAQALRIAQEQVQALQEELESSIEELKSSSEEMQSVNEELQSTNEELETSKEELQSVNEELSTVNAELESKVTDLSRANDDMNNLLAGTGIATVFVDHGLRIMRFTPGASEIIPLIEGDIGRPVGHLASNLDGYDRLTTDTQAVLDSLIPRLRDVRTRAGKWFAMRIQPYRTMQNVIEGAVITFVDITDSVRTRQALRRTSEVLRLAVLVRDAFDAVTVHDPGGRTLAWNPAAAALYGWTEDEALALHLEDRVPEDLRPEVLVSLQRLAQAEVEEPVLTRRLTKDGRSINVWVKATALQGDDGQVYAIATTEHAVPPEPD